jgi:hypothetical protein
MRCEELVLRLQDQNIHIESEGFLYLARTIAAAGVGSACGLGTSPTPGPLDVGVLALVPKMRMREARAEDKIFFPGPNCTWNQSRL